MSWTIRVSQVCFAAWVLAGLGACSDSDSPTGGDGGDLVPKGSMQVLAFEGAQACSALEQHIEDTAEAMMREQLESFGNVSHGSEGPSSDAAAPVTAPENSSHSQTNVRQAGVDEPDPVKNDGRRLFSLRRDAAGLTLSAMALTPPDAMSLLGQTGWQASAVSLTDASPVAAESPQGLFLSDPDTVLALSTADNTYIHPVAIGAPDAVSTASPVLCLDSGCGPGFQSWIPPRTRVRNFDVSADAAPVEQWLLEVPGRLLAARRIDSMLYLVTQSSLRMPEGVRSVPDVDYSRVRTGSQAWREAVSATIAENNRLIRASTLSDWLGKLEVSQRLGGPQGTVTTTGNTAPSASDCARFARVDVATRLAWLQISSIDLNTRELSSQTLLADGQGVYMSNRSLIVFTSYWRQGDERANPRNLTVLHRFDRNDSGTLTYDASGSFAGRLINDYAIDETSDGTIRVAATDRDPVAYSHLSTLRKQGEALAVIGSTPRIADGETLQSARFIGDRAYLVTFRQVDPFFVFDLGDPTQPRQLGELKLPGFSSYLHPIDADHILGIGFDGGGWPLRLKATLFDVTNPGNPVEQMSLALGNSYTSSDATWDPHAFTLYRPAADAESALLAVPVRSYASGAYGTADESGIRLLQIRPAAPSAALQLQGTLTMTDLLDGAHRYDGWRRTDVRRAVFIDDTVYAVSDGAVRAANIGNLSAPSDTLLIP